MAARLPGSRRIRARLQTLDRKDAERSPRVVASQAKTLGELRRWMSFGMPSLISTQELECSADFRFNEHLWSVKHGNQLRSEPGTTLGTNRLSSALSRSPWRQLRSTVLGKMASGKRRRNQAPLLLAGAFHSKKR